MVTHILAGLSLEEAMEDLQALLEYAGPIDRELRAQVGKSDHDQNRNQDLHRDEVLPGVLGIFGLDMKEGENGVAEARKVFIKQASQPDVFNLHK